MTETRTETAEIGKPAIWTGLPVLLHSSRTAVSALVPALVARLPLARGVLGVDHDASDYAVAAGRSAYGFLATVRGDGTRSSSWRDSGELFRAARPRIRVSVFILGLLCALLRSDQAAYRFGGITPAIVMSVPRTGPAWQIAFHRFAEVSIGIGVALVLTVFWP